VLNHIKKNSPHDGYSGPFETIRQSKGTHILNVTTVGKKGVLLIDMFRVLMIRKYIAAWFNSGCDFFYEMLATICKKYPLTGGWGPISMP